MNPIPLTRSPKFSYALLLLSKGGPFHSLICAFCHYHVYYPLLICANAFDLPFCSFHTLHPTVHACKPMYAWIRRQNHTKLFYIIHYHYVNPTSLPYLMSLIFPIFHFFKFINAPIFDIMMKFSSHLNHTLSFNKLSNL